MTPDEQFQSSPSAETFLRLAAIHYPQEITIDEGIRGSHLVELPLHAMTV
jgi:hypothetical protein